MKNVFVIAALSLVVGCASVKPVTGPKEVSLPAPKIKDVRPISAIVVSQCGEAIALYIQLDANNLFRADPKQSELFTNKDDEMIHTFGAPMPWDEAYDLASKAVLSSHVVIPCDGGYGT